MQINNYYQAELIRTAFAAAPPDIATIIARLGGGDEALFNPTVNLYVARWIVDAEGWRIDRND
jgi:hypothetical protein